MIYAIYFLWLLTVLSFFLLHEVLVFKHSIPNEQLWSCVVIITFTNCILYYHFFYYVVLVFYLQKMVNVHNSAYQKHNFTVLASGSMTKTLSFYLQ